MCVNKLMRDSIVSLDRVDVLWNFVKFRDIKLKVKNKIMSLK